MRTNQNPNATFLAKHIAIQNRIADKEERTNRLMFELLRKDAPVARTGVYYNAFSSSASAAAPSPAHTSSSSSSKPTQPRRRRRSSSSEADAAPTRAGKLPASPSRMSQWFRRGLQRSSRRKKAKADQQAVASNPDAGGGPRYSDDSHAASNSGRSRELGGGPSGSTADASFYYFASVQDSPRCKARASSFKLGHVLSTITDEMGGEATDTSGDAEKLRAALMTSKGPNWKVA